MARASVAFSPVAPQSPRWRVIIAEDDPVVRQVLVDLVADDAGLTCAGVAGDALEAVDLARQEQPDVAVVDVKMPGGGGPHAAREIRTVSPHTRIIAFSAFDDDAAKAEMRKAGAAAFLVKGVSVRALLVAIRDVCGARS
jgi:DNA-binding NarL/FixJ family response regulator